jgi:hypothetical protein
MIIGYKTITPKPQSPGISFFGVAPLAYPAAATNMVPRTDLCSWPNHYAYRTDEAVEPANRNVVADLQPVDFDPAPEANLDRSPQSNLRHQAKRRHPNGIHRREAHNQGQEPDHSERGFRDSLRGPNAVLEARWHN